MQVILTEQEYQALKDAAVPDDKIRQLAQEKVDLAMKDFRIRFAEAFKKMFPNEGLPPWRIQELRDAFSVIQPDIR